MVSSLLKAASQCAKMELLTTIKKEEEDHEQDYDDWA